MNESSLLPQQAPPRPDNSAELVVIEDDPRDRMLVREMLDEGRVVGMRMAEASSAAQGELLIGTQTLCVLLDNLLPDGTGMDLLENLRAQYPWLAVILLTGSGDERTAVDALQNGANDYLAKGDMTPGRLRDSIIGAVDKMRLAETVRRRNAQLALMADMIDSADDLLFVVDIEHESVIQGNSAARRALGRLDISLDDQPAPVASIFKAGSASWISLSAMLRKSSPVRFETTVWVGSYLSRPVEINARLVLRDGKRYAICIARDISEQRRLRSDLLQYAAIDPETELPRAPAFLAHLRNSATADADWLLILLDIPRIDASADEAGLLEIPARRQAVARLVARFAAQHGGSCGLLSQGRYLIAVAENACLDLQGTLDGLRHEAETAVSGLPPLPSILKRLPMDQLVGIGLLIGSAGRLASEDALERALAEAQQSPRGAGRLFKPRRYGDAVAPRHGR